MKPTFLGHDKPLLTAMVIRKTPEDFIDIIGKSLEDGAEAIGLQMEHLEPRFRTREIVTSIFAACKGKPIYVTSYRDAGSEGLTDEQCAEYLLFLLDCGATLCDFQTNLFDKDATREYTRNPDAIAKQKALAAEIHRRGGEVMMSAHTGSLLTPAETLELARAQIERGSDISKIVNGSADDGLPACVETIRLLRKELGAPYLYLVGGPCAKMVRQIGPALGVHMYLCVHMYGELDAKLQPLIVPLKAVRDNLVI